MRRIYRIRKRQRARNTSLRKRARHQKRPKGSGFRDVHSKVRVRRVKLSLNKAGKWRKRF